MKKAKEHNQAFALYVQQGLSIRKIVGSQIQLKNFFIICDRDEVLDDYDSDLWYREKEIKGPKGSGYRAKLHKFLWNRRCIENYLVSSSARHALADAVSDEIVSSWASAVGRDQKEKYRRKNMLEKSEALALCSMTRTALMISLCRL